MCHIYKNLIFRISYFSHHNLFWLKDCYVYPNAAMT